LSTLSVTFITITCDGACGKSVTFAQTQEEERQAVKDNPWMNTVRVLQSKDKRQFLYCSDQCEIEAASAGNHNPLEEKKIATSVNQSQIDFAARAAHIAAEANKAMKSGSGISVHQ
jgi:hypothetical protein